MADLQKVAGKKMKKRKFFKKGKPTLASKVAKLQKIVKATSSSIEWKRQYFWISNANYAPNIQDPDISNFETDHVLSNQGLCLCPTDWLFNQSGSDPLNMVQQTGQLYAFGDGIVGNKIQAKYLQVGVTMKSYNPFDATLDQNFPLFPVRVIIVRGKGGAAFLPSSPGSGTGLPLAQREGSWNTPLSFSRALFGNEAGGWSNSSYVPVRSPVIAPLDRDMGGKSKQFRVLLDEIIDPKVTISGGQYSTNGSYSRILKIPLDMPVTFEDKLTANSLYPSYFNGANASYDDGCIQVILVNDYDIASAKPANFNNQVVNVSGFLSYTDA